MWSGIILLEGKLWKVKGTYCKHSAITKKVTTNKPIVVIKCNIKTTQKEKRNKATKNKWVNRKETANSRFKANFVEFILNIMNSN